MATSTAPRLVRALAAAAALASLGACGFTPLYATPGVSSGLQSIAIEAPKGRVPYLLREQLDDLLGHDKSAPPAWRLDLTVVQTRDPRGLRLDNVAERYDLGLTVKYQLTSLATGKVAHTGEVTTDVSYDAANAPYAGIAARQDSQQRAAADAARRIQIQLAAWMASRAAE
jgi:LPS-assembly lipoprotein